jgi:hypothetical protein
MNGAKIRTTNYIYRCPKSETCYAMRLSPENSIEEALVAVPFRQDQTHPLHLFYFSKFNFQARSKYRAQLL